MLRCASSLSESHFDHPLGPPRRRARQPRELRRAAPGKSPPGRGGVRNRYRPRLAARPPGRPHLDRRARVLSRRRDHCPGGRRTPDQRVRPPDRRAASGICISCRIPTPEPDPLAELEDLLDIHFGVADYGYGWVFHHGRYYSVGIGGLRACLHRPIEVFRRFCATVGLNPPANTAVRGHLVPRGGLPRRAGRRPSASGRGRGRLRRSVLWRRIGLRHPLRPDRGRSRMRAICQGDLRAGNLVEYAHCCDCEFGRNLRSSTPGWPT